MTSFFKFGYFSEINGFVLSSALAGKIYVGDKQAIKMSCGNRIYVENKN